MISFSFNIRNPWSNRWKCIKSWSGDAPFKHKHWEMQFDKSDDLIGFQFRWTIGQDHPGLFVSMQFIGYEFIFNFYDERHWN